MKKIFTSLGGTGSLTRFSKVKNDILKNTDEPYFIVIDSEEDKNNIQAKITNSEDNKNE